MPIPRPLARLRKLSLALPEAHEVEAWGEPTFRVRNKMFAMFAGASNHHGGGRHSVWVKCAPTNQQLLINSDSGRYFFPPYVGPSGWVGVYLDGSPDWSAIAELLRDGYVMVAPARLKAQLREPRQA
jgi:predicted DNA-binding protein (MmcQ/YjbR family)